ncbi:MAG: 3-methyl-2-oxobutanoate hydroxymethyltransferase [Alphaproteobacteria bacterium PRO2]|nr:3-methyl-2-oxobutanoate hydroxymethyltransferase [Alphaproteobacteria bacterium PRO2]
MDTASGRKTIPEIRAAKGAAQPIVCLTAYTAPVARILDRHADILLVGDSLGNVIYGLENTLAVDLEMMIRHGQAVVRSAQKACVIIDMPFGTYEENAEQAFRNALRIMKETGCDAVKLEGGQDMAQTIQYLTARNIPVMAHIGLQPQSVLKDGGYKIKGRTSEDEAKLLADAKAVEKAGAFSVVIEGTVEDVAAKLTNSISIPAIGIGASAACDGQVLVIDDMIGLTADVPKFVKKYADVAGEIEKAAAAFAADVRAKKFPDAEHVYTRPRPAIVKDKAS